MLYLCIYQRKKDIWIGEKRFRARETLSQGRDKSSQGRPILLTSMLKNNCQLWQPHKEHPLWAMVSGRSQQWGFGVKVGYKGCVLEWFSWQDRWLECWPVWTGLIWGRVGNAGYSWQDLGGGRDSESGLMLYLETVSDLHSVVTWNQPISWATQGGANSCKVRVLGGEGARQSWIHHQSLHCRTRGKRGENEARWASGCYLQQYLGKTLLQWSGEFCSLSNKYLPSVCCESDLG